MARSKALLSVLGLVGDEGMSVEQMFLRDLRYSIEKEDENSNYVASKSYKPSSLHCIRNMWFQLMGVEPKKERASSELIGICESGTDRHNRIQWAVEKMKDNGIDCEYVEVGEYVKTHNLEDRLEIISKQGNETKLFHKLLNIRFLCDGIIRYRSAYYILEIKTETSNKFWDQKGVMEGHKLQGTAYSLCLDIDKVLFLYECRDNCAKKTFMLDVTNDMKQDLVAKIITCDEYVEKELCPPKPRDVDKRTCAYCNYASMCRKE